MDTAVNVWTGPVDTISFVAMEKATLDHLAGFMITRPHACTYHIAQKPNRKMENMGFPISLIIFIHKKCKDDQKTHILFIKNGKNSRVARGAKNIWARYFSGPEKAMHFVKVPKDQIYA